MTTAILSALPEEQSGLLASLQQAAQVRHAGRVFSRGVLQGQPVVLALSGIGKVAAATTAAALIERFGATRIVFTGVAGGLGEGVRVGDVVVAQDYVQHDMDASPLFARWQVPGYAGVRLPCDAALTALLSGAVSACLESAGGHFDHEFMQDAPRLHQGLVASGDRFVTCAQVSRALREPLRAAGHEVLAVEMEGAAVAQVCLDYGVPFAAVRTISDRADDDAHVDFPRFIAAVASRYADHIVRALLLSL
ncbi:5'-methylthioadenosine/S-adenosylhomocysteine nucleosidase [Acidovorax sp. SRB_14]|uniref:5'-methylthioadenosine/adenosylhomocysteine nucleosidase n=1 Tax=Acidovorax sp. SRB_14 TaxID=1962699 RepID=UPI00146AD352|nr:5'-methylthioadenosine/adenosylhomocysteine nucleosidase [Acidovorax sp. SRB_14]NMM81923.1 5'-methylthioadenosine/S-adenosylhomocysteine nucleosidase [Acidovorax sp. SRB_14]NMM89462.1 5'-methylthioadenosine/S-adenosylhomocysteine nucleosidase [Rhodococcus sp. SRB_17]